MNYLVHTPCGDVKGTDSKYKNIIAFKGIKYAKAKRFEFPEEVTSWKGVYDASKYGDTCPQFRAFQDEEAQGRFYYKEFRKGLTYTYSEDSLNLNIFVPKDAKEDDNLAVIIYIHGGSFTGGSGFEKQFDEPVWPKENVIGVTINYRLNVFGFCCFNRNDIHVNGNLGLYDQLVAIDWIRHNIKSFGGNPNNITLMGQSAGAMSIQHLCFSKLAKDKFNKAIMLSGGGVFPIVKTSTLNKAYIIGDKILDKLNINDFKTLQNIDMEILWNAWNDVMKQEKGFLTCGPVIDNNIIVDQQSKLIKRNTQMKIPYIIGSTSEDIFPPIVYLMARSYLKKAKKNNPNIYQYFFNHQLPGDNCGAWHSSDLFYFFGTLSSSWRPMSDVDYKLSDVMVKHICEFAKNNKPNDDWTSGNKEVMIFGNGKYEMGKVKILPLVKQLFKKTTGF